MSFVFYSINMQNTTESLDQHTREDVGAGRDSGSVEQLLLAVNQGPVYARRQLYLNPTGIVLRSLFLSFSFNGASNWPGRLCW